jgi:hypothetical protein
MVSSTSATVGTPTAGNNATVTVEGLGSRWLMTSPTNTFAIGHSIAVGDSNGTVTIGSGGEISAAGPTTIYTNGRLTLNGGTFKTTEMNFQGSGQFEWTSGTLHVGTFNGDLTNSNGKLAPGNSPGITTINGDYVQGSDGVLEIEVGGTMTAGTDYDLVIVSDNAEIDGHLQVPIINGFMPQVGNRIRFLTADSITGTFSSISSPGLAVANPLVPVAIEVEVVDVVEDNTQAFEINFVAPRTNLVFDEDDMNEANWAAATTWTGAEPGAVPGTANVITIDNLTGAAQTVNVETEDAFVHSLEIASTSAPITVAVKEGFSLSAVTSVAIGNEAAVIIDDGRLVGSNISVEAGGLLAGNGTVVGNLVVGAGGGSDDAILRPGLSPGEFKVEGNYQQTADGTLLVEIDGIATEEFDRLRVSGSVALGGTLQIDASALTTASDGTTYEIITAGSLSGTFDTVESVGNDSIYFREIYDYAGGGFGVSQQARGDMNGIDDINSADYDLFVFALMNDDIAKWFEKCPVCRGTEELGAIYPQDGGDFSGNGIVDFDDIAHFQNQLGGMGMSSAGLAAAFERYFNHVPEPSSAMLVLCCGLMEGLVAGRGRRIMGVLLTGRLAFGRSRI